MPEDRRLAAIMFTDIVGYTALMGRDEDQAFDMLKRNHTIHETLIKKHNGTLIKEIGDGTLASFSLSSNAVHCAMDIQKEAKNLKIPLKIGIHGGEMVFAGSDVLGDSVNIASRLQESTPKGCISISGSVNRDIKNKAGINTKFIEEKSFKNVDDPIRVYEVECEKKAEEEPQTSEYVEERIVKNRYPYYILSGVFIVIIITILIWYNLPKQTSVTEEPELEKSIAVLPLDYLSEDQNKQYLADGVMDAITGHLSKIEGLRVTPRTSVEQYRKTTKKASIIGEELGVSYLIEGSFLMVENQVRITIQLVIAEEEAHVLYREYDKDWSEIFDVQSEVAQVIAKEVAVMITPEIKERIESNPTDNLEAYNLYLQGRHFWIREGKDNLDKSIEYYKQALEIDPNFALAYAGMAVTYNSYGWYLYSPYSDVIPLAKKAAMKALEIDNTLGEAHTELAIAQLLLDWDWSESEKEFKQALELNPNSARAHNRYAWLLTYLGRHDEAIEESKRAHDLDPLDVNIWIEFGRRYYFAQEYDMAIEKYRKVLELFPNNKYSSISWYARAELALALSQKGLSDEAIEEYLKAEFEPTYRWSLGFIYGIAGKREKAEEILNYYLDRSKKEFVPLSHFALIYIALGEKDKAFEWLEKSYAQREGMMLHLKVDPRLDNLRSDPRFQDLLERINFPD